MDGCPDQFFGVFGRPLVQVNAQFERSVRGEFLVQVTVERVRVIRLVADQQPGVAAYVPVSLRGLVNIGQTGLFRTRYCSARLSFHEQRYALLT